MYDVYMDGITEPTAYFQDGPWLTVDDNAYFVVGLLLF